MYIINGVKSGLNNKRLIRCTVIMNGLLNKVGSIHTLFFQLKINESVIKMTMHTKHGSSWNFWYLSFYSISQVVELFSPGFLLLFLSNRCKSAKVNKIIFCIKLFIIIECLELIKQFFNSDCFYCTFSYDLLTTFSLSFKNNLCGCMNT